MKRFLYLWAMILIGAFMLTSPLYGDEIEFDSAHIYPSGAQVRIKAPSLGHNTIVLPGTFDASKIQLVPSKGITLKRAQISRQTRSDWVPPAFHVLQGLIKDKKEELISMEAQLAALEQWSTVMESTTPSDLTINNMEKYLQSAEDMRRAKETEKAILKKGIEELKQTIADLEKELAEKMPQTDGKIIAITYETEGEGELFVDAWTDRAWWAPEYYLYLSTKDHLLSGKMTGKVSQNTGIPWNGPLYLHTAQPISTVTTPELPPLVVDYREEELRSQAINMTMGKRITFDRTSSVFPMEETLTDQVLKAQGRVDGDNIPVNLEVAALSFPVSVTIESIPSLSPQGWIIVTTDEVQEPLLGGQASLFVDDLPSGQTFMRAVSRGEKITTAFGQTPSITTKREDVISKGGSNWVGKGRVAKGYTITLTNGLPTTEEIVVKDRIPVSAQEKITVEVGTVDPAPTEKDQAKGLLSWKIALKPGEQKKITVLYQISYPADKEIWFLEH
ncbi:MULTISPECIES: DUF4139 domain-containing protein [Aminobacterium]|jgi:hypothetical protein|uniref:DUF4139 domain-containing protein n=1 Tax=Aminobacterium TaxID=81466 RepID=UPI00257EC3F8|nr:DUF4139 domain-containing protein [Aminobacterium sp. UBA4834]